MCGYPHLSFKILVGLAKICFSPQGDFTPGNVSRNLSRNFLLPQWLRGGVELGSTSSTFRNASCKAETNFSGKCNMLPATCIATFRGINQ